MLHQILGAPPLLSMSFSRNRNIVSFPYTPVMDNASTQMELLNGKAAVQTSDCRKCQNLSPGAWTGSRTASKRCAQVEDFLQLRRLYNIRKAEELDSWFQAQSAVDQPLMAKHPKIPPWAHTEGREVSNAEEWKPAKAGTCRTSLRSLRYRCRTASLLCRLKRKDSTFHGKCWS